MAYMNYTKKLRISNILNFLCVVYITYTEYCNILWGTARAFQKYISLDFG